MAPPASVDFQGSLVFLAVKVRRVNPELLEDLVLQVWKVPQVLSEILAHLVSKDPPEKLVRLVRLVCLVLLAMQHAVAALATPW